MKMKHIKVLIIALFAIMFMLVLSTKVEAATASIKCESTGEVGKPIQITVTGTGVQWNLKLLVDGQPIATSSELENYESNKTISFSGTYTPTSEGKKTVTLQGSVTEFNDGSTITNFQSASITVNPKPTTTTPSTGGSTTTTQPAKGTVTSCVVDGIAIKESRNVTNKDSVSVKVVTSTGEGLTIYNNKTKKSYSAKSGQEINVQIMEGTNTLTITLESGATATRKVYSKKQEEVKPNVEEPSQVPQQPEETEAPVEVIVGLQSLVINGVTIEEEKITLPFTPTFASDVYEYQMLLDDSFSEDFTKLDIEAIALQEDFIVEITGLEDELEEGENIITITVKSADGEKVVTYTITVTKEATVMPISAPVEEEPQDEIEPIWNETQQIIIVVFTSVVALMGIIYAIVEYRYQKGKKDEEVSKIPYSGLDFEKDQEEEDTTKKKRKSKKQQKLEAEQEAENLFQKMTNPKEETRNSIIDNSKEEKVDNINQMNETKDIDNILGTNNMDFGKTDNGLETPQEQSRKRGKHF